MGSFVSFFQFLRNFFNLAVFSKIRTFSVNKGATNEFILSHFSGDLSSEMLNLEV